MRKCLEVQGKGEDNEKEVKLSEHKSHTQMTNDQVY